MHASSVPTPQGYDELHSAAALFDPGLGLVSIEGEDRKGWLQGQVTQDLTRFPIGFSSDACLVAATGQLVAVLRLWALPDRIVALTEAPDALFERAKKFVVMEDVRATVVDWTVLSVQGPSASRELGALAHLPVQDVGEGELDGSPVLWMRSRRTFSGGWDVAVPKGSRAEDVLRQVIPAASAEAFSLATLEAGIPMFGVDTDAKSLPPELGRRFEAHHVNYGKGCYMGQEVLMRIHSRGHTNRTWVGLLLEGPAHAGDPVTSTGGVEAGRVTRAFESPRYSWIGAATLKNAYAEPGTIVRVKGCEAEVIEPPFYEAD